MEYTLDYFIKKFEAIPEDQWTTDMFVDDEGCKCAYGHCGAVKSVDDSLEASALHQIDKKTMKPLIGLTIANINDSNHVNYRNFGSTPKQRVVNYLKSLKPQPQS